jgi:hypothetical protein
MNHPIRRNSHRRSATANLLNIDQRHIGSIPAAIFRLTFGPRPCGTYACTASATYGTADNGIGPHVEEFCAIASINSVVVITAARIREVSSPHRSHLDSR